MINVWIPLEKVYVTGCEYIVTHKGDLVSSKLIFFFIIPFIFCTCSYAKIYLTEIFKLVMKHTKGELKYIHPIL